MNSFACLQSSRRALYRVFVQHEALLTRQFQPPRALPIQNRFFSASQLNARKSKKREEEVETDPFADEGQDRSFDRRYTTQEEFEKSGRDRLPQDFEIKDPKIMVLDNGVFDGPLLTKNVLSRLPETDSLRMVTPYIPGDPKNNKPTQYAICKIVNKREEYERQRELTQRRRLSKQTTPKTKEVEMSWAISEHDLGVKTQQLVGFLSKGMKVELILGFKKKGQKRRTSEDTAEEVYTKVNKLVEQLGSREYKPRDGEVGKTMRIYLEGIIKQARAKPQEEQELPEVGAQKDV
ncbi:Translation initiation factor IF-3 [Fusarium oxysporum f. sp. rapae]|uniref:Translation initiation factor IF-3 n=1 Tax=Fusarium oxysporum f. sp. rapae TaxID=485398 RepID=A0A8J5P526_FUSOX|nr:Translation initiation factor IF-3 [Fusarium oxysporum f. sp. rapae]